MNLTHIACFQTVGGSQSTVREPMQTHGEHENSSQKGPDLGIGFLL